MSERLVVFACSAFVSYMLFSMLGRIAGDKDKKKG